MMRERLRTHSFENPRKILVYLLRASNEYREFLCIFRSNDRRIANHLTTSSFQRYTYFFFRNILLLSVRYFLFKQRPLKVILSDCPFRRILRGFEYYHCPTRRRQELLELIRTPCNGRAIGYDVDWPIEKSTRGRSASSSCAVDLRVFAWTDGFELRRRTTATPAKRPLLRHHVQPIFALPVREW